MHPQVRLPESGRCPICAIPLIRVNDIEWDKRGSDEPTVTLSSRAHAAAGIETVAIERHELNHELRARVTCGRDAQCAQ